MLGLLQAVAVLMFAYPIFARELDVQRRAVLIDKMQHARRVLADAAGARFPMGKSGRLVELISGYPELHLAWPRSRAANYMSGSAAKPLNRYPCCVFDVWDDTDEVMISSVPLRGSFVLPAKSGSDRR